MLPLNPNPYRAKANNPSTNRNSSEKGVNRGHSGITNRGAESDGSSKMKAEGFCYPVGKPITGPEGSKKHGRTPPRNDPQTDHEEPRYRRSYLEPTIQSLSSEEEQTSTPRKGKQRYPGAGPRDQRFGNQGEQYWSEAMRANPVAAKGAEQRRTGKGVAKDRKGWAETINKAKGKGGKQAEWRAAQTKQSKNRGAMTEQQPTQTPKDQKGEAALGTSPSEEQREQDGLDQQQDAEHSSKKRDAPATEQTEEMQNLTGA